MTVIRAAGILILDDSGKALFLKRGPGSDCPGMWGFPGGRLEEGESALDAAIRETREEAGYSADPKALKPWSRRVANRETTGATPTPAPGEVLPVNAAGGAALPLSLPPGDAVVAEGQVDFETFLLAGVKPFTPELGPENDPEHVAYAWAPPDQPPEPLHPGCRIALAKLEFDELGIARAMVAGELSSPQRYKNVTLFNLRITGTGAAFRPTLNEWVYRRPENYLNDDFLARCNGLPVIMLHPKRGEIDSKEFSDRIVGTMMLPYVRGDEVWGIAKVYDDDAIELMTTEQVSTSPMVILRGGGDSKKMTLEDGSTLIVEGKASLLDHLAICQKGVWDKMAEPAGVEVNELARGDSAVTEEEKKAADAAEEMKKKADAEEEDKKNKKSDGEGEMLDKVLKGIDSLGKRMDAFEDNFKKKDAEDEEKKKDKKSDDMDMADSKKKDATNDDDKSEDKIADKKSDSDDKKEEDKKSDSAPVMTAADLVKLNKRLDDIAKMAEPMSDAVFATMAEHQARADAVYSMFGKRAPRPQVGESELGYRKRLAEGVRDHSPRWGKVILTALGSEAFGVAEEQVYADAAAAAMNPATIPEGEERMIITTDTTGRQIKNFHGKASWVKGYAAPRRRLSGIRNNG